MTKSLSWRNGIKSSYCLIFRMISMAFLIALSMTPIANAEIMRFDYPKYKGDVLNICYQWSKQCGKPAADAWCRYKGYSAASNWKKVGRHKLNKPTRVMGSGTVCDAGNCSGFRSITCLSPQRYTYPKYKGNVLNICYKWSKQCGKPAADAWCRYKGYSAASNWKKIGRHELNRATRVMGSGTICDAGNCSGFRSIVCR